MRLFKYHAGVTRSRSIATPAIGLFLLAVVGFALAFAGSARSATAINLGAAASFGALSFTAMTNAGGDTVVSGDVGSPTSVGAGVTNPGFARYNGPADAAGMASAQAAVTAAYLAAEAQPTTGDVTGNLGGTKGPGVYDSSSAILINSALTLDGGGDPNAVFIFRAVSDLTVEVGASVTYTNGAQPCNVFWKVQSAWLKNSGSTFVGTILALTQITLTDNITVQGRVLARNADVTFIHDTIVRPTCAAPVVTTAPTTAPTTTAATTTAATTAATTTVATTTAATTTAATTTAGATTSTATTPGSTTPGSTTPGSTTPRSTTPASPTATTTTAPKTPAAARAAKAAAAKAAKASPLRVRKPTRGHARPPRHSFGLTG